MSVDCFMTLFIRKKQGHASFILVTLECPEVFLGLITDATQKFPKEDNYLLFNKVFIKNIVCTKTVRNFGDTTIMSLWNMHYIGRRCAINQ